MEEKSVYESKVENADGDNLYEISALMRERAVDDEGNPKLNEKGKPVYNRFRHTATVFVDFGDTIPKVRKVFGDEMLMRAWIKFCEESLQSQVKQAIEQGKPEKIEKIERNFQPWIDPEKVKAMAELQAIKAKQAAIMEKFPELNN